MPTHAYTAAGHPPTVIDHLLAHCFELMVCAFAMLGGAASIFSALSTAATVSPALDKLSPLFAGIVGGMLLIGGFLVWLGLLDDSENLMTGWRYERVGLVLLTAAWASYGVTIASSNGAAVLSWGLCVFMGLACVLRYVATVRQERRTRRAIR